MSNTPWFKRRRYGYGWVPVTWQGWLTVVVFFVAAFATIPILANAPPNSQLVTAVYFLVYLAALIAILVFVCIKKGSKATWRWGKKDTDNSDEDF